jgi:hypothetical protein
VTFLKLGWRVSCFARVPNTFKKRNKKEILVEIFSKMENSVLNRVSEKIPDLPVDR